MATNSMRKYHHKAWKIAKSPSSISISSPKGIYEIEENWMQIDEKKICITYRVITVIKCTLYLKNLCSKNSKCVLSKCILFIQNIWPFLLKIWKLLSFTSVLDTRVKTYQIVCNEIFFAIYGRQVSLKKDQEKLYICEK